MDVVKLSTSGIFAYQKYANFLAGNTAFRPVYIAVVHNTTPFISAYPWSSGFGTKYANPATLPPSAGNGVAFGK